MRQCCVTVYRHISGVYNTRVFFGVIIHEIHRAVQEFYDSSYALTHVWAARWAAMAFRSHFSIRTPYEALFCSQCITLLAFYCNKYLFIPTLHGNLKFHNYSIHTIPNTALLGVFHGEPPGATQFTTNINLWQFSLLNRSINSTLTRLISRPTIIISFFLSL